MKKIMLRKFRVDIVRLKTDFCITKMMDIHSLNWEATYETLNQKGFAILPKVLSPAECQHLAGLYGDCGLYRATINMKRYRFGVGEYKYFSYPLPPVIQVLREMFYSPLCGLANDWMHQLDIKTDFPHHHRDLILQCRDNNQMRPTPLMLRYETGGFNTLHQDLYGDVYFPFQIIFVLTQPGRDHVGGELILTEQIPRAQSKAAVLQPNQGDALILTTNFRPAMGARGYYRSKMKHGVSEVKSGVRYSLGIIFHDAA
ncbi:MAG: 2OG-Fe(II) oxygenase [Cyclobacteriaceae bacterium]|nr:2OG-Fe(II) oxygenase [Cyclobacteriaceae bacterium]MDH4298472.1 2OG-Fe(II) oxygenase [Cyclobacteriaceae bacterium]MDH5248097.1 2OG-Fe(II) oxygenase [Cyclobacteriaceae bacterium]